MYTLCLYRYFVSTRYYIHITIAGIDVRVAHYLTQYFIPSQLLDHLFSVSEAFILLIFIQIQMHILQLISLYKWLQI